MIENRFDEDGIHEETGSIFDTEGYDAEGFSLEGFDRRGIHRESDTRFGPDHASEYHALSTPVPESQSPWQASF